VKQLLFLLLTSLILAQASFGAAKDKRIPESVTAKVSKTFDSKLQSIFGDQEFTVEYYDDQLKHISVGSEHLFVSHDGRYVFAGPVYDTDRNVDIVEERQKLSRQFLLKSKPANFFVQYPSNTTEKYSLTVFTAINCPYCRKLHNSIPELNQSGVSVNYVMLPRGAINSAPYAQTLSALCSGDPSKTVTQAMMNHSLETKKCDSKQLEQHISLARELKVNSTPTFVLPNGALQIGYVDTDRLLALLAGVENENN
jgi:thiol:disulfide interchange protein DsbC